MTYWHDISFIIQKVILSKSKTHWNPALAFRKECANKNEFLIYQLKHMFPGESMDEDVPIGSQDPFPFPPFQTKVMLNFWPHNGHISNFKF